MGSPRKPPRDAPIYTPSQLSYNENIYDTLFWDDERQTDRETYRETDRATDRDRDTDRDRYDWPTILAYRG